MKIKITQNNLPSLCMVGYYALLLFFPHTIGNKHVRAITAEFLLLILPGLLIYKLFFNNQEDDLYHRLSLFFLLSCFFYLITASIAYYFRLNLLLFMRGQLFLFIVASGMILYKDENNPAKINEEGNTSIWDYGILLIVAIIVYVYTCDGPWVGMSDAVDHIAVAIKIAESGVIAPYNPFLKGVGPLVSYLYSPYHVILALIKQLSAVDRLTAWHHTPKLIFFFLPLCYYTLIKVAFKNKTFAYFALFFMLGLIFSDYYWRVLQEPVSRRFLRELLIPIYYIILIQYFRTQNKKDLVLLVISTMALGMFHLTGLPFVFLNGLVYFLLFLVFKNKKEIIKKITFAYILILLFNLPYALAVLINSPVGKTAANVRSFASTFPLIRFARGIATFRPIEYFSTDTVFGYLAIILLILIQSNSVLTLIMFAALLFVPLITHFPPIVYFITKFTGTLAVYRLTDISIRPFFSIGLVILSTFYVLKYLEETKTRQKNTVIYWSAIVSIIGINTYLINQYFWIHQIYFYPDLLVGIQLKGLLKAIPVLLTLIASVLYIKLNRKKTFGIKKLTVFNFKNKSILTAVLFIPLILNTIKNLPEFISKSSITPIIKTTNTGRYTLDENYIPTLFKYISTNEKPNSVIVLFNWHVPYKKDYLDSFEFAQFIPQYVYHRIWSPYIPYEEMLMRRRVSKDIYDVIVSLDETLNLIYENEINYVVAHGDDHKKFSKMTDNLLLVSQDKKKSREFSSNLFMNNEKLLKHLIDENILHHSENKLSYVHFDQSIKNKDILKKRLDLVGIKDKEQIEVILTEWKYSQDIYLYKVLAPAKYN